MTDKELFLSYYKKQNPNLDIKVHNNILILLHGSYKCNSNCIYCENHCLREEYLNATISKDILDQIIEKLGPIIREITWHGGEPLLLSEDILSYLEQIKKEKGYIFPTTLQTNSILLNEEKYNFLNSLNINWGTSFDGLKNDLSRGEKSTKAVLDLISRHKDEVGFICVYYNDTINNIIQNYEYFKSLQVKNVQSCIVRENVIEDSNLYLINNDDALNYMTNYIDYWIHDINNPINDYYVERQILRVLNIPSNCEDDYCIGGWIYIDAFGNIGFCGQSPKDTPILNINDINNYTDFLNNKNYLNIIGKQIKLEENCSLCEWRNVCHGGCMGINYETNHNYEILNPRHCEYTKNLLTNVYELIKNIDITRKDIYNPIFLQLLELNSYKTLNEIKELNKING